MSIATSTILAVSRSYQFGKFGGMRQNNLENMRIKRGLTRQQLADRVNVTETTIYRKERGDRKLSDRDIPRYAMALRCKPEDLVTDESTRKVPVIGQVGAGQAIFPIDDLPIINIGPNQQDGDYVNCDFVDAPPGYESGVVALRVMGDSMMPFLPEGTIVYFSKRAEKVEECLGKLAIVALTDGRILLKRLRRGYQNNRFNLESFNAQLIEDVELAWCAKVIFIKPD